MAALNRAGRGDRRPVLERVLDHPHGLAAGIGQRYYGPVVLITDARCYSATDIFCAGFADHRIGPVLGVDANTGAGGANVWTHGLLHQLVTTWRASRSPYRDLPGEVDMRVAIRRTLRVGAAAGTPVEDLGVVPDERHLDDPARHRARQHRRDHPRRVAAAQPARRGLGVDGTAGADGVLVLEVTCVGIDRLDVWLDERPVSLDVQDRVTRLDLPASGARLRLAGYTGGRLVASLEELGPSPTARSASSTAPRWSPRPPHRSRSGSVPSCGRPSRPPHCSARSAT